MTVAVEEIEHARSDLHACFESSSVVGKDGDPFLFAHCETCGSEVALVVVR